MADIQLTEENNNAQLIPCRVCAELKPISGFYNRQVRRDLSAGECKDCTKERVRNRARNDPKVREYDRKRAKLPHRRAHSQAISKKWRADNPMGYKAHSAVSNAIRDGRLEREPCYFCQSAEVHAHHKDYSKPLDVIWLCPKCHHRLHKAFPETEAQSKGAA